MKPFFALAGLLVLCSFNETQAQEGEINLKKLKDFKILDSGKFKMPGYHKNFRNNNHAIPFIVLNNNESVMVLPLDNMPCFVPDVSRISKMPNQQNTVIAIKIPNVFGLVK